MKIDSLNLTQNSNFNTFNLQQLVSDNLNHKQIKHSDVFIKTIQEQTLLQKNSSLSRLDYVLNLIKRFKNLENNIKTFFEPEIVDLKTIYPFLNADETVILDKLRRGKRKYDYSEYAILSEPAKKAAEDLTKFALEPAEENLYYSKLLKSYLDDKFGEKKYVFVSIGRSPSTIARCMEKLAVKTVYCPISCFRMKQLPLITNVSGFSNYSNYLAKHGLNKQNLEQSGKTWVFYDYTESGDSLLAYKNLMTQHFSLPLNKTDFRSLNEDLILIAPEYKKVIDFAGRFFALSLSHKFGGVPELPWQDVGLINRVKLTNKNLLGFNCYKFALQNLIEKEKKI